MLTNRLNSSIVAVAHTVVETMLGELTIVARGETVVGLYFPHHWYRPSAESFGPYRKTGFDAVHREVDEYLGGERREFDVPVELSGTRFQQRVWDLVRLIPYGETRTYGDLATQMGDGSTPQEVGAAVGRNPVCLLVPCHRVVGAGGKLTGYAGGLDRKRALLEMESEVAALQWRLF